MKKCTQCGQTLSDETKFCFKCGGGNFEPAADAGSYQQQPYQQQPQQGYQQPIYNNTYIQQPGYQAAGYDNNEPVTVGNFIVFFLLMLIPVFNIIYLIMVAVGGPKYKKSLTNFARAAIIWGLIAGALATIISVVVGASIFSMFSGGYSLY